MPFIDLKAAVDEAAEKFPDRLKPVLVAFAGELVAKLKEALIGRKITITIE